MSISICSIFLFTLDYLFGLLVYILYGAAWIFPAFDIYVILISALFPSLVAVRRAHLYLYQPISLYQSIPAYISLSHHSILFYSTYYSIRAAGR